MVTSMLVFLILFLVGITAHFQTLKFGLFGDDWQSIYVFLSQDKSTGFFSNLPGIFKYLTMYGSQVLFTGTAYKLFSHNYVYYYLISLFLKVCASFSFYHAVNFLSSQPLGKRGLNLTALLGAILALTGVTGIQ